jgi:hypothetical protein
VRAPELLVGRRVAVALEHLTHAAVRDVRVASRIATTDVSRLLALGCAVRRVGHVVLAAGARRSLARVAVIPVPLVRSIRVARSISVVRHVSSPPSNESSVDVKGNEHTVRAA